jgi:hypothetical protein
MLKTLARKFGLWKPAKKPPISVSDWDKLKAFGRVQRKADKIAKEAGLHVSKTARSSRKPTKNDIREIAEAVIIEERKR